ncbi:MAG: sensor histidine kinase [Sphingobacteriales bacterium]|nr:sensor histidine kinase [Sphingobacteriales bacterium]
MGSCLFFILIFGFFIFFYIKIKQRHNRLLLNEQKVKSEFEQALLRTQLEIREQTLKIISEEIHDNIGQALSLAKLKLNTLKYDRPDLLVEKINDSRDLVSKAIQDLRDLSRSLNTDGIASLGLVRALEQELELFRKTGFYTRLHVQGSSRKLEPEKELIIFRILQESLNNIIRHAEANSITVSIVYLDNRLELQIQDDGKGASMEQLDMEGNSNRSLGLRNMSSRAKMIGGTFSIKSEPGNGTIIKLNIPFNNN